MRFAAAQRYTLEIFERMPVHRPLAQWNIEASKRLRLFAKEEKL